MTNPSNDTDRAAEKIAGYLRALIARSGLNLEFNLQRNPGDAAPVTGQPVPPMIVVEFSGADTALLLARNGELLHAVEHIAAKILQLEPEDHESIRFDADNYKANRDRELLRTAETAIKRVRATGQPYAFPPMTSRERRMLHLILSSSGLPTASSGEGPRRFVVLYPEDSAPSRNSSAGISSPQDAAARTEAIRNRFRRR